MQITDGLFSILNKSGVYSFVQSMIGSERGINILLEQYIKPFQGCMILDIGCGPADILKRMNNVNYYGFDLSPAYIQTAQKQYGNRGHFFCASVTDEIELDGLTFDIILILGVLHHLSDEEISAMMNFAKKKNETIW